LDKNQNSIKIESLTKNLIFINSSTSLNSEAVSKICKDKSFTYQILSKKINMPKTLDFLDPNVNHQYSYYLEFKSEI